MGSFGRFLWSSLRPLRSKWDFVVDLGGLAVSGGLGAVIGQNLQWAIVGGVIGFSALLIVGGTRLQSRVDDLDESKAAVDAVFLPDDQMARLVVINEGGVRATFEAKVVEIGGSTEIYDAPWGDRAELQSTISPGSKDFINIALFDYHDDKLMVCPIRAGKTRETVKDDSGTRIIERYDAHNPRPVSGTAPVRFTLDISSEAHPNETDRVQTEVGYDQPDGGGKYHNLVEIEHRVAGKPLNT